MLPAGLKAGVAGTAGLFVRAQSGAAARDAAQDDGFIDRSGSMLERGWQGTAGGIARAAGTIAPGSVGATIRQSARTLEDASAAPIAGEKTWDDLKANPTIAGFGQYVVEQGLVSLPEMALLATPGGVAVSATGRAGNIAQNRAQNDGREDASLGDLAIAAPFAGASAALDKVGLEGIFKTPGANFATRIGRAAGIEAGTEAIQGGIEGIGGSIGTQAGVDWQQVGDDALAGAVAGGGMGGGIRAGVEIASGIGKRITAKGKREQLRDGDVSILSDEDRASPIPDDMIAAGKAGMIEAEAESIEAAVLQKAGMPGIGSQIAYEIPGKPPIMGTVEGAFNEVLDGERVAGIIIRTADGKILRDHFDDIADAGAVVRPVAPEDFTAAADAIDAQLRAGAQAPAPLAPATASLQPPVLAQDQISTPSSAANRFDMGRYMAKNRRAESGGNDQAKAATSSASGRYQFTDGTWLQYHAKVFGNTGETREQILAKKRDGAVQDRLMMELTSDNAKALRGAGLPVNDANLYLAHFLGIGGALKLLRAGPNAPLSEAIDAKQIAANKAVFKGRQTAGDVIAWAAAKMGQPVDPASMAGGAAMPQGQGTEYADVDFGTARRAPVAPIEIRTEERDEVITTARDRDVKVRYGVVEARDLVASNTPDGRVNPNYPADMQPRDRTRASSQMQIQQISSKLRPYWLGRTFRPDDGAPVISPDGVVESGNGRTIAIQQVYEQGGPKAEEYRRFVETQGIDTTGMQQPVLVRLRTEQMAPEDARQFAREANMATSLGMAPTEQAFADSDALPEGIMSLYQGGDVDAAANRDFVRRYMDSVMSPGEAANLRRADGSPNPRAFARIRNAMLARAYDNPRLVENLSESNDSNIVAIGGALTDLAGIWSKMRQEIASGQIAPEYDITENVNEAIELVERARREGRPLVDLVNQREMFTGETTNPVTEAVLRLLFNRPDFTKPAGRKRVRERLQAYLDIAAAARTDQGSLLDEPASPDVAGAVGAARGMEGYEETAAQPQQIPEPSPAGARSGASAGGEQDARPGRESVPPQGGEQAGSVSPAPAEPQADPADDFDRMDVVAVVDANNQVRNVKKPAAEREAFRAGAQFQMGLLTAEKAQPTVEAYGEQFRAGMKAAKAELRKRNGRKTDRAETGSVTTPAPLTSRIVPELPVATGAEAAGRKAFTEGKPREVPSYAKGVAAKRFLKGYDDAARVARARGDSPSAMETTTAPAAKPLDAERKYPKPDQPVSVFAPIDETLVPVEFSAEDFAKITDQFSELFAEPGKQRVSLPKTMPYISPSEAAKRIAEWEEAARNQNPYRADATNKQRANADKTVLSLFDLTGEWSRPWEEAGYNVIRFDIQNDPVFGDVNNFSVDFFNENYDISDVYAILAACPCTEFASSGARHFAAKDADGRTELAKELVFQTLRTIEYFRPTIWALENPVGRIANLTGLPQARLAFDPNHFGDPYTKRTQIWGQFEANLPLAPVEPVEGSKMWSQYGGKSQATKNARSATPKGFSYAFFQANNAADVPAQRRLTAKYPEASGAVSKALEAGVSPERIEELMYDTYENFEYEAARNALIAEVAQPKHPRTGETLSAALARANALRDRFPAVGGNAAPGTHNIPNSAPVEGGGTRGDLRQRIADKMLEGPAQQGREAHLVLGPPAAGKSTLAEPLAAARGARIIDSDDAKTQLPEFEDGVGAQAVHEESSKIADGAVDAAMQRGDNILLPILGKTASGVEAKIDGLVQAGYKVYLHIVDLPSDKAAERAVARFKSRGRLLDPDFVRSVGNKPMETFDAMLAKYGDALGGYVHVSNDVAQGQPPRLVRTSDDALAAAVRGSRGNRSASVGGRPESERAVPERNAGGTAQEAVSRVNAPAADPAPSPNRLVSEERAAELRKRLKEKLNPGRLNAGIDPEIIAIGTELAVYHIEKGARRFQAFANAIAADLGMKVQDLRLYMRGWYNGARDMMEDAGESVAGMDTPDEVAKSMRTLDQWADSSPMTAEPDSAMEAGDGVQKTLPGSDAAAGTADVQPAAPQRGARRARAEQSQGSLFDVQPARGERGEAAQRPAERPARDQGSGGTGVRDADRVRESGRDRATVTAQDWSIEPGALAESRGAMQKARDNVAAIEIIRTLEQEARPATPEEQAKLARYVGWGGLANAFPGPDGSYGKGFEDIGPRLKELLTEEEYDTARRSIQYAHYTSETIVRGMWDMARKLGFKGGNVFEPGMGTGNFRGMMPADIAAASRYQGLEFDGLTAKIAKALYPKSGVRQDDYTKTPQVIDAFDLVIGNPPFADIAISSDPAYAKQKFLLHDYFFAKSLDALRPGGLLMFVTSAGTMNKIDTKARDYFHERADLVGAIRLPGNAFKQNAGTEVTTDIVILRKRMPGERPQSASWTETVARELPTRDGGRKTGQVSRYFAENPDMVLGEEGFFDKLIAGERYGVRAPAGFNFEQALSEAAAKLPANVLGERSDTLQNAAEDFDLNAGNRKEGSFYIGENGKLMQMRGGTGRAVQTRGKGVEGGITAADQERIRKLVPIRDALTEVYAHDLAGDAAKADAARAKLNSVYDAFVKAYGPINKAEFTYRRPTIIQQESARAEAREEARLAGSAWDEGSFDIEPFLERNAKLAEIARARAEAREAAKKAGRKWDEGSFDPEEMPDIIIDKRPNIDAFMADQSGYRLRAIEHYDDATGEAKKTKVFYENVITLEAKPEIRSAQDALLYSLNKVGYPDLQFIADMAGMSKDQVLAEIGDRIFEVPGKPGVYETREKYLSGNVRAKLSAARMEAESDPLFERNVAALEAVQPPQLTPDDIIASLGMPWIPADVIEQFGTERLGLRSLKAKYLKSLAQWTVGGDTYSAAATVEWGTRRIEAPVLISNALNRITPKVFDTFRDAQGNSKQQLNEAETQAAQDKLIEIKKAFSEWVWTDPARAKRMADMYNEAYNSHVAPVYDGSYLKTPGIASFWRWRPHQSRVVARVIQSGNTYMAHEVGAGKTSAMIGSGMEMRRLGLVNKPMYVVPNHMLGQFTKEFYEQYPTARIKVADEKSFHTDARKQFVADMAAEDLDAVIITHSAFGFIGVSPEFQDKLVQKQIDDLRDALAEIGKGQEVRLTRKKIENQIEKLEQRLAGKSRKKRDEVLTFEETGVDFLFVDEAHLFRKLDFATKMTDIKGIDPNGSKMAFDLYAKIKLLESRRPGRSVVLASGTPITNTMAELYTVSRYLQESELEERGLAHFDAWAGAFGDTATALEQDAAGGYKAITRFAKFMNVPELSVMVRQVMDVVSANDLRQYVTLPQFKRNMIVVEQTESQSDYQETLKTRMQAIEQRKGPPKKGDDIMLSVIGDGRKSAIDARLIDASNPKEPSKLEAMIENVAKIHKETARTAFFKPQADGYSKEPVDYGPAAQMIFSDFGINGDFPVHKYIRNQLVMRGIPGKQIAIIGDYKTHVARQRLFNDVNEGKVRVLIGSVAKMGTGVNAQMRLRANHNLDPQWYPANDIQRNGRIIRQGNMNPEVDIYDYSTKGTYDSTMWQMMERKARFIEGFMRGDPNMRDMEDLGEASVYEQAKAMSTADPRILELTELRQDLEKEERRRSAFHREQRSIKERIASREHDIATYQARIPLIDKDIAQRVDIKGDAFTGEVDGKTYTDRAEFGNALMDGLEKLAAGMTGGIAEGRLGSLGGFNLFGVITPGIDGPFPRIVVKRNGERESVVRDFESAVGLVSRIRNVLSGFEGERADAESIIKRAEQEIEDYRPKLGGTFPGQAKIAELTAKVNEIEAVLSAETKKADAQAALREALEESDEVVIYDRNNNPISPTRYSIPEQQDAFGGATRDDARRALERKMDGRAKAKRPQKAPGSDGGLFDQGGAQGSLFSMVDPGKARTFNRDLAEQLRGLGLTDKIHLYVVDKIEEEPRAAGLFKRRNITFSNGKKLIARGIMVATASTQDPAFTLNHEAIHALRDLGMFTEMEWATLSRRARENTWLMATVKQRYAGLSEEAQTEEAVADMYAMWADGRLEGKGFMRAAFERLRSFMEAVRNALRGLGFQTAADIMRAVQRGDVGQREPVDGGRMAQRVNAAMSVVAASDARWTPSRIRDLISEFSVTHNGKSKAYAASMTPDDFLSLTTPAGMRDGLETDAGELRPDELAAETQPIFLLVSGGEGGIYTTRGHEGRHRMAALKRAGVERVPVVIRLTDVPWSNLEPQDMFVLLRQQFGNTSGTRNAIVRDLVPISNDFKGELTEKFGGDGDIRFSIPAREDLVASITGKGSAFTAKASAVFDRWRTAMQDRYLPLLRVQQRIEAQLGRPLTEAENPYLGEELMTGRIGARLERLTDDMVEPLIEAMHSEGVSIDELETYLYARHAPERNARIAEINPEFAEGTGSGMTDTEAAAIMNRIERDGRMDAMKRLAARVDAIRDAALDYRVKGGLMSKDEADAWRKVYKDYVPLRGRAEIDEMSGDIRINRSGGGINVAGKESRMAFGRRSKADSILAYTIMQAEEAIVRAETNKVAQRFVELAEKAPDAKFWQVNKVTRKPVLDKVTGLVRYENQTRVQDGDRDYTVTAKFNGIEKRVTMNRDNPAARRLADSMRNLTQHQLDWVTQHLGKLNRFLSAVNTSYNPEFLITNAFRDIQTATVNMVGIDRDGLIKGTLRDYPAALKGSVKGAFKRGSGEWGRWYTEFVNEGGRVYFNQVESVAEIRKRVQDSFALAASRKGDGPKRIALKRAFKSVTDLVDAANTGVENAIRLAAYKNARESGMSKEQAASLAKNLTVNFNRRGTFGPAMNAAYLFFNASMQGSVRILQATRSPKVRKVLAGVAVSAIALELMNALMAGEDDDGENFYDKISDFDKSRNMIVMLPEGGGAHIKIPLPYGYNVFWNLGRTMGEIGRRGGDRWQESMGNWVGSVVDAFNPVGGTESLMNFLAPTAIDPIVDLERNRDFTDRPIMPEQNPYGADVPDAQRYYPSVGPHWRSVTELLTAATGGDAITPGAIDVSPETLEHLSGVVLGAAGSFLDRNVGLLGKIMEGGEEVEANDLPLVRKIVGQKPGWYDKAVYYDRTKEVEQALAYAKGYAEREEWDGFDLYVERQADILSLEAVTKAAQKEMRAIRKEKSKLEFAKQLGKIDDTTYRAEKKVLQDAEKLVADAFNSEWNATMNPGG